VILRSDIFITCLVGMITAFEMIVDALAPQGIDAVIADVMAMTQQVKVIGFNIFDRDLSLEWQNVVSNFRESNEVAKNATRNLIDSSFQRLRSAEGAFELLQNFKKIESKGAIKEQMESKLNDILLQFSREMDKVAEIFEQQRCGHSSAHKQAVNSP
jgi:dynein heavy chain, axonemal